MEIDESVMKAALAPGVRSMMLLGATGAGKTSLSCALAAALSKKYATGVLDLDMGQASVGPPSTLAWALASGQEKIRPEAIYFTGAMSPSGNMLPALAGARLLMDKALSRCEKLVIDTTGFVEGPAARAYKQYKIDLLRPGIIVALERRDELEHILSPYSMMASPVITRVIPSPLARNRSAAERADFREKRLRAFFEGSNLFEVDLKKCGLRRTRSSLEGPLEGALVSFRNASGEDLSLGVIEKTDFDRGLLLVRSPLDERARYACVVIGSASFPAARGPLP